MTPRRLIGAVCLLSGCTMTVAELSQAPPNEVRYFPVATPALSDCVNHVIELRGYTTTLQHPNRDNVVITATQMVDAITRSEMAVADVRFLAQDQGTTVELRNGTFGGQLVGREAWTFVEQCAKTGKKPSGPPWVDTPLVPPHRLSRF